MNPIKVLNNEFLSQNEVDTVFWEMVNTIDLAVSVASTAIHGMELDNEKRSGVAEKFGISTNYLKSSGLVHHDIEGDTSELARSIHPDTRSLIEKRIDQEIDAQKLLDRAKDEARPSSEGVGEKEARAIIASIYDTENAQFAKAT